MSATDELRRLLDERGVEWRKAPHYSGESQDNETIFEGNGIEWYTNDHMNGQLGLRALRYEVTPAQAIDATLGRGTCKIDSFADVRFAEEDNPEHDYEYATLAECSKCGAVLLMPPPYIWYDEDSLYAATNYCPNCGAKVVDDAQDDG